MAKEDRNSPATKGDLEQLRSEVRGQGEQLRSELKEQSEQFRSELKEQGEQLRSEFQHGFDDLNEAIRDNQTEMLKAFYGFVQSNQERFKAAEDAEVGMKKRLAVLEDRLNAVERRLNMPPAA